MNNHHTPGPWTCHSGMVWSQQGPRPDRPGIEQVDVPIARMDRDTRFTEPTERDRNAELCAAAPRLLAALQAVTPQLEVFLRHGLTDYDNKAVIEARAAIDNATANDATTAAKKGGSI